AQVPSRDLDAFARVARGEAFDELVADELHRRTAGDAQKNAQTNCPNANVPEVDRRTKTGDPAPPGLHNVACALFRHALALVEVAGRNHINVDLERERAV